MPASPYRGEQIPILTPPRRRGRVHRPFVEPELRDPDRANRNKALIELQENPRFKAHMQDHFEYDAAQQAYIARRRPHYAIHPVLQPHVGHYQVQAVMQHEVARVLPHYRDIETFHRPADTYDRARKFNEESRKKRPLDGRAMSYVNIGPWLRLRLLKSTVHITRKGTPPFKAYKILAKHILKQIKFAETPRIVMPILDKQKQSLRTLASPERLANIQESDLAKLCQTGLRKKAKNIIYRQTNVGGPLFEIAKKEEVLY